MSSPFIIWTMQRTGGTALTDLLMDMSEHKRADHEPFNWSRTKSRQFWPVVEAWNKSKNDAKLAQDLDEIFAQKYLIKHCYELFGMPFNTRLIEAAAQTDYRHVFLRRRDEPARLISKFIAEANGTWFKDYASRVFADIRSGDRRLAPLPVSDIVAQFEHCRNMTKAVCAKLEDLNVDCHELDYEDLYIGERDPRRTRLIDFLEFLDFTPTEIDQHRPAIEKTLFEAGQNTESVAQFVPNIDEVKKALAAAEAGDVSSVPAAAQAPSRIVQEFEKLAQKYGVWGPYLEIGTSRQTQAVTSADHFKGTERHLVNIAESDGLNGASFYQCDTHDMRGLFADGCFGTVIANATLEHDKHFWLSVEEMKRVLAPGGILMVVASGFSQAPKQAGIQILGPKGNPVPHTTPTYEVHGSPDYWRFSPQAMKQVILDGFEVKEVRSMMMPPRIVGVAMKPV
jgi:SAM-dependent methyltransferase